MINKDPREFSCMDDRPDNNGYGYDWKYYVWANGSNERIPEDDEDNDIDWEAHTENNF